MRYFYMSPEEWEVTPWWKQKILLDGIQAEQPWNRHQNRDSFELSENDFPDMDDGSNNDPDDLSDVGINVQQI